MAESLIPAALTRPGRDSAAGYETAQPTTAEKLGELTDLLSPALAERDGPARASPDQPGEFPAPITAWPADETCRSSVR
jgi:hypothetical protein